MPTHFLPEVTTAFGGWLDDLSPAERVPRFVTQLGEYQKLHQITGAGAGVKIGIGDTGVSALRGADDLDLVAEKDFTNSRHGAKDVAGHGTHVACMAAANGRDGFLGVAPKAKVVNAKVLGDSGAGPSMGIANGIDWMVDQGCDVINLSLGGGFSRAIEDACQRAQRADVWVVASMGNSGTRSDGHPGNSDNTLGIACIDYDYDVQRYSSRSNKTIYSGFGMQIISCGLDGSYVRKTGTSMASPFVAGQLALVRSYLKANNPVALEGMGMLELFYLLEPSIRDLGPNGWDRASGYGFIELWDFLERQGAPDPTPDPDPDPEPEPDPIKCGQLVGTLSFVDGIDYNVHRKPSDAIQPDPIDDSSR